MNDTEQLSVPQSREERLHAIFEMYLGCSNTLAETLLSILFLLNHEQNGFSNKCTIRTIEDAIHDIRLSHAKMRSDFEWMQSQVFRLLGRTAQWKFVEVVHDDIWQRITGTVMNLHAALSKLNQAQDCTQVKSNIAEIVTDLPPTLCDFGFSFLRDSTSSVEGTQLCIEDDLKRTLPPYVSETVKMRPIQASNESQNDEAIERQKAFVAYFGNFLSECTTVQLPDNCTIKIVVDQKVDERIGKAKDRIIQILKNLAINALQSAAKTPITVLLSVYINEEGFLAITSRDSGPGMPDATRTAILQDTKVSITTKGSGMYLRSIRKQCEESGGAMSIESSPQSGCEIRITIPLSALREEEK